MRLFASATFALAIVACGQTQAELSNDALRACLRDHVRVSVIAVEKIRGAALFETYRNVRIKVHNGFDWAVSGIVFEYVVKSPDRSVPWVEATRSLSIPGGIEPNEERELTLQIDNMPTDPLSSDAVLNLAVHDIADEQRRQIIRSPIVVSWAREKSARGCQ